VSVTSLSPGSVKVTVFLANTATSFVSSLPRTRILSFALPTSATFAASLTVAATTSCLVRSNSRSEFPSTSSESSTLRGCSPGGWGGLGPSCGSLGSSGGFLGSSSGGFGAGSTV
jgi:hypothetical protein